MKRSRKPKVRADSKSKFLTIHIPPEDRAYIIKWIPNRNWSEICCQALLREAEESKKRDGKL